jgi:hypothetical protein
MQGEIFPENPIELSDFLKRIGLWNEKTQAVYFDIISNLENTQLYEEYKAALMPDVLSRLENASPFSAPDESVDGRIRFANTEQGKPIGINPEECHVLVAGQTNSGKTTLLRIIFSQALSLEEYETGKATEKIICWLFVKAHDMRSLLKVEKNTLVVTFNEIKLNPLEPPPGIKAIEWASIFADLWIQAFRLYEGSKGFLIECLHALYLKNSKSGYYPSLYDLYYYVRALKFPAISRNARYQESVLNRLGGLIKGSLADVFDCSRGHINNLVSTHAIFEILYLTAEQQVFMVNYLLSYLFYYKMIQETGLRHWVAIDDANLIFDVSYEKRPDLGLPVIHHLLTTVRKNRINIFACTQTPHQLGASIHSNAFAKIMFSLSHGKDIEQMQQSMGIKDAEQKAYCFKLEPRRIVVKFAARYQKPFVGIVQEAE